MSDHPGFFQGTGMPDPGWWEALWPEPARVLSDLGLKPGMEVIDLCSGDGWFTLHIARVARKVTAIDIDGKLLETAQIRLKEGGLANCSFIEADAYDIAELVPHAVDFVFLANALHGVPDKPRLLKGISSALKPTGRLAIVNWHARAREETQVLGQPRGPATELRMAPQAVTAAAEATGLAVIGTVEIPSYHYGVIFEKKTA